jgi:hypothetical protein
MALGKVGLRRNTGPSWPLKALFESSCENPSARYNSNVTWEQPLGCQECPHLLGPDLSSTSRYRAAIVLELVSTSFSVR